jgi:protoheme ferro-lyase
MQQIKDHTKKIALGLKKRFNKYSVCYQRWYGLHNWSKPESSVQYHLLLKHTGTYVNYVTK